MDIPAKIAAKICSKLDAIDLAVAGCSIPYWYHAFKVERFIIVIEDYVREMAWLDRNLCELLFPQPAPNRFLFPADAICYQLAARRYPIPHNTLDKRFKNSKITFLTLSDDSYTPFMSQIPEKYEIECALPVLRYSLNSFKDDPEMPGIDMSFELKRSYADEYWKRVNELLGAPQSVEAKRSEQLRLLRAYDGIIIFIDLKRSIGSEICTIAEALTSRQKLIFAVVRDVSDEKQSNTDYLMKLYNKLGGDKNPPLVSTAAKWRLWCVNHNKLTYSNLEKLLQWEYLDICANELQDW